MATKVLMPQLGESVTEGTISKWLVNVGDFVKKYQPLAEVTTDKVNAEVPSTVTGRITELVVPEGETVAVGTLIAYIEEEGAEGGTADDSAPQAAAAATPAPAAPAAPAAAPATAPAATAAAIPANGAKQRYSPAVMRLAQEHNLDLSLITGTGANGRITRKDVLQAIEQGIPNAPAAPAQPSAAAAAAAPAAPAPAAQPEVIKVASQPAAATVGTMEIPVYPGDQVLPVTAVRRTIANRMVQSKHEAPHAWTMVEVDVTNLVKFRNAVKDEFKRKEGFNLTFLPFFIKAVVESLKEYPILNSVWAGDKIIVRKNINISIAVATDDALYVPVIKDADQKSIYGIAKAVEDLASRTRAGKLTMEDMSGGTFTVNNTGSFGAVMSMPIINHPQAAIMSVEAIVKRPVVLDDDMIAIRSMVNLCLSLDHRVLDGLVCGRFLQSVKRKLESMGPDTNLY